MPAKQCLQQKVPPKHADFFHKALVPLSPSTLSRKSCQAWRNALLSENIDHSRFAEHGAELLVGQRLTRPIYCLDFPT